ncbi:MAG: SCP2 sterol-binding domain-containing protein [Promethearchaeota archaeon]
MSDSKNFGRILYYLEHEQEDVVELLDKFFQSRIKFIERHKEILEELQNFEKSYQIHLTDVNFNFWINISDGSITYHRGINKNSITTFEFTKDLMIKILKQEISFSEAYMKGLFKIHGSLSYAIELRNFIKTLFKYRKNYFNK